MFNRVDVNADANPDDIVQRAQAMNERANHETPFTEAELDSIIQSLKSISRNENSLDFKALRSLLAEICHLSHKDWAMTAKNSEALSKLLLPDGMSASARQMLDRIIQEGNWGGAEARAANQIKPDEPTWAVLVTGVNGIRKTTSIYQPWFTELLMEALVVPPGADPISDQRLLPGGQTAFFRQLDHMIATLCNEEFSHLYKLTGAKTNGDQDPPQDLVKTYSDLKAAIFSRYRTLSELLGVMLVREAQKSNLNCMMETSGRDAAMFMYVDEFFGSNYNKLALHFVINDLAFAQESVDARMISEIKAGVNAVVKQDVQKVIYANAGGPYGSEVLAGVQEASDRVWNNLIIQDSTVGQDWYKATIIINGHPTDPWTAQALRPDGSLGTPYSFERRE